MPKVRISFTGDSSKLSPLEAMAENRLGLKSGSTLLNYGDEDPTDTINIKDSSGIKSGKYSKRTIQNIAKAAKAVGINPYNAIAVWLQESGKDASNYGRVGKYGPPLAPMNLSDAQKLEADKLYSSNGLDPQATRLAVMLRDKLNYGRTLGYKTEPEQLQAFNGYGIINPKSFGNSKTAYGVDITNGVDLSKNPLYGKRVFQLKNDLQSNKELAALLR